MSPLLIAAATFSSVVMGVIGCCLAVLDIQNKSREMGQKDRVRLQQRLKAGIESLDEQTDRLPLKCRDSIPQRQTISAGTVALCPRASTQGTPITHVTRRPSAIAFSITAPPTSVKR